MGWLIDKIREWFCEHEYELLCDNDVWMIHPNYPSYHQWIYVCKKCGRKKKITNE